MSSKVMLARWASPSIKKARGRGFALAELAIATAIFSVMIVSGMAYYKRQLQIETAHALAEQYKIVNNAVGAYMVNHWLELVALPQDCGKSTWFVGASPTNPGTPCTKTLGTTVVVNALQPTIENLVKLGYLPQGHAGPVLQPDPDVDVRTPTGSAAHTFGVSIEAVCTGADCSDPASRRDLKSVVFNARPYANVNNQLFTILAEALSALPNDAGMSIPIGTNSVPLDLVGRAKPSTPNQIPDNSFINIPNPVRVDGAKGQSGILGVRNGYGSSGFQQFTRRDGGAPPVASWDFNAQNLTKVQDFDASRISATSAMKLKNQDVGDVCDSNIHSIASSLVSKALLICDAGKWALPVSKLRGIDPDPANAATFQVIATAGTNTVVPSIYKASDYGMPGILGVTQGNSLKLIDFKDAYCAKVDTNQNNNGTPVNQRDDYFTCQDYDFNILRDSFYKADALTFNIQVNAAGLWEVAYNNLNGNRDHLINVRLYRRIN